MARGDRSNLVQWAVALAVGIAIDLPSALNRRHFVSHSEAAHVFAAIFAIAVFTLIIRLVFLLVASLYRRARGGRQQASSPGAQGSREKGRSNRWPFLSLLPFGVGAWAPVLPGVRFGVRRWTAFGLLWAGLALAGWVVGFAHTGTRSGLAGTLILLAWVGGIITSFNIHPGSNSGSAAYSPRNGVSWPEPTPRSERWSLRYALAAYVITFVVANGVGAILYFGFDVRHLGTGVGVLIVDAVLLGALVPLKRRRGLTLPDLGLRSAPAPRSLGPAVLAFIAYLVIIECWIAVTHPHNSAKTLSDVHEGTAKVVLAVIAAAASAPIVEEIFFRGLLYRSFRNRLPILPAALIAGALFGLVHITSYPLDTLPVKAGFGVIACLLYERTGSLLPGIGLHSFIDASAVDVSLTGSDEIVLAAFAALALAIFSYAAAKRIAGRRGARSATLG